MGAMSVYQNSHVRIELFSYVKVFVYPEILITSWYVSERSIVFSLSIRVFNGLKYGPIYTNPVIF